MGPFQYGKRKTKISRIIQGTIAPLEIVAEDIKKPGDTPGNQWP